MARRVGRGRDTYVNRFVVDDRDPEIDIDHAPRTIDAGHHIVMVNVEADALAGPALAERTRHANVVYSLAYGDQSAMIWELVDWARTCDFEVICAGKGAPTVLPPTEPGQRLGGMGVLRGTHQQRSAQPLHAGEILDGEGGFAVRGKLTPASESLRHNALPIGMAHFPLTRPIAEGAIVTWDDVDVHADPPTLQLRRETEKLAQP